MVQTTWVKFWILIHLIFLFGCSAKNNEEASFLSMKYAELVKIKSDSSVVHIYTSDSAQVPYFEWSSKKAANRIVCLSPTQLSYLSVLNQNRKLVGSSRLEGIFDDKLRDELIAQSVIEVGAQGSDTERIIDLQPDLIIFSANSELSNFAHLEKLEIPGMPFLAHLERHPLGRLEWIKCIGMVTGSFAESADYFNSIAQNYEQLLVGNVPASATFFVGYIYNNSWYVAGGNSYLAQFIEDAGGRYLLDDDPHSGSFTISKEHAFELLSQADVWLHPGYGITQYDQIKHGEELKGLTKPDIRIYNNNLRMNELGSNDFWQSGIVRPDLVLKDLITIVINKENSLIYYRAIK
jgi:iron complex transport system substrate-binding protein